MSNNPKEQSNIGITPVVDMKSFMDLIAKSEDKTKITALLELLKESNLELITEYPTVKYTKEMTKLNTWRTSIEQVFNLDEDDRDTIILEMCRQFMLKMVSHKRRRSVEIVNALKNDDANTNIFNENSGRKRFLGMR